MDKTNAPVIEVKGLKKNFGTLEVLRGVDLTVEKGEVVAVIGPSGSGKSTMLRCLIDLEKASGGTILIEGEAFVQDGNYVPEKSVKRICSKMGMVFQQFNLFPHMSVEDNLISAPLNVAKMKPEQAKAKALQLLRKVGLEDKLKAYPAALSGGQKQRVAIARALMMSPDIILFDEPTSALDPELTGEVLSVIKDLAAEKMTMVVVTHEMGFAREIADKVVFMENGEILACGAPSEIFGANASDRMKAFVQKVL